MPETITKDQLLELADKEIRGQLGSITDRAHGRGDGMAVYTNNDLGHPDAGHQQFCSYGSKAAQLEPNVLGEDGLPPTKMPDIGGRINWRYQLTHICPAPEA